MAINKNFVIKNGVQVSTDLIIGDADNNKVGIGTTIPGYDLHIGRGRKSRGGIGATDLVVTGVATVTNLNVTGISTFAGALDVNSTVDFAGDVVFNGTNDITFDQSESALVLNDGAALRVGTGSDFSISHDGNNTILRDNGTGDLQIYASRIELGGASVDETIAMFTENGGAQLFFNNVNKFETTGVGATVFGDLVVSGVTTSARLLVSGISTFTGLVDANGGAHIDNLRLGIDADNDITTSSGNLTLDSTGGTVEVNDNLQVDGQTDLNGDINLGNATSDTITPTGRFDADIVPASDGAIDLGSSSLEFADLHIDGTAHIDTLDVDESAFVTTTLTVGTGLTVHPHGNLAVAGITTIGGVLQVNTGIRPDSDEGAYLGDASNPFSSGHIGEVVIASGSNDGTIDTATGNLTLDSAGGTVVVDDILSVTGNVDIAGNVDIDDTTQSTSATTGALKIDGGLGVAKNVNIGGNLTVTGTTTFNGGTITLGDADTDNVVFSADVDSSITPDDDDTHDLGSATKEWRDLHVDGIAHLDNVEAGIGTFSSNLLVSGISTFTGLVDANGGATIDNIRIGVAQNNEIDTSSGNLILDSSGGTVQISDHLTVSLDLDVDGTANLDVVDVDGTANFASDVTLVATGSSTIHFDASAFDLTFQDNIRAKFGTGKDLTIFHDGTDSYIQEQGTGHLKLVTQAGGIVTIEEADANIAVFTADSGVQLNDGGNNARLNTNVGGVTVTGVATATGFAVNEGNIVLGDSDGGSGTDHRIVFGDGSDLKIYHNGSHSVIDNSTGTLFTLADTVRFNNNANNKTLLTATDGGAVELYHNNGSRVTTTADGTDFGGTGSIRLPNGTTAQRNASPAAGDFRYNTTTGKFEGYTDEWGDIGGGTVEETDTSVSTTSATSTGSFAKADFRSASIIAQITQGSAYQVGRYLLIHDGTTVTTIEESAVATGSMLGTFEGVINGSNVEFRVTMSSSSSATITTKIDTISIP